MDIFTITYIIYTTYTMQNPYKKKFGNDENDDIIKIQADNIINNSMRRLSMPCVGELDLFLENFLI